MDGIWDSGIAIVLFLQNLGGWLEAPMKFFTFLGNEEFYLLAAPALFWCIDATLGFRLGLMLMLSGGLNNIFKLALHGPRPYWYSAEVNALSVETSFGVPSGHAQNAVTVWGTFAAGVRRRWVWWIVVFVMLFISLSRLYLGVHFPHDTLAGWLIGAALLWGWLRFEQPVVNWLKKRSAWQQVGLAFLVALALIGLEVGAQLSLNGWAMPQEWSTRALAVMEEGEEFVPASLEGQFTVAGALFGMICGFIFMRAYGGFAAAGTWGQRAVRFLLGLAGVLILWRGLGMFLPGGENWLAYILRFIRYTLVGAWITGFAPWIFKKLNLAD